MGLPRHVLACSAMFSAPGFNAHKQLFGLFDINSMNHRSQVLFSFNLISVVNTAWFLLPFMYAFSLFCVKSHYASQCTLADVSPNFLVFLLGYKSDARFETLHSNTALSLVSMSVCHLADSLPT